MYNHKCKSLSIVHFSLTQLSPLCEPYTFSTSCSVAKSCLTLHSPMDCNTPGFRILHYLLKFARVNVHLIGDAIQPSHLLLT